ncbi:MAG: hypothetical protein ACE5SW_00615 [Nitrososphaeraceae archaeon]
MKKKGVLWILSGIIIFLGILFIAQSQSIVGPTQSFMYDNPEWSINGSILLSVGILIMISCVVISLWKNKRV